MSMTSYALNNTRVTCVALGVVLVAGVSYYGAMPKKMDPGFTIRQAQVVTLFPGASPERVEELVTDPIETKIREMPELKTVESTSRNGLSLVTVEFLFQTPNLVKAFDDLREKMTEVQAELPSGVQGPSVNDQLGDVYPIVYSISYDGFSAREVGEIAEDIRDQLLKIDGVAKVKILGQQDEQVYVDFDNAQLAQLGLSPTELQGILDSTNIIESGGDIDIGDEEIPLEPTGNFDTIDELASTLVSLPSGAVVSLDSFSKVYRDYVDPRETVITHRGSPALGIAIYMSDQDNLLTLGTEVQAFFNRLLSVYPHGLDFEVAYYQPTAVENKISDFMSSVIQAVLIVLVVMLLSLGIRTGLIVSTLIPSAMIAAIAYLGVADESINQMSLAALIIALGLLVDNAIVVSELILVRLGQGATPFDAAADSCKELQTPLLISSLTTAAAFLPIALAEHAVAEYTGILFVVVTVTLLASWILALTVVPLLCVFFMKAPKKNEDEFNTKPYQIYRSALGFVLRNRIVTLVVVIVLFVGSLPLWSIVPQNFFPAMGRPFFMAEFSLPYGTNIEATRAMCARLDEFIKAEMLASDDREGVDSWTTFIGETPPTFTLGYVASPSLSGFSELMINTSSVEVIPELMAKLQAFAQEEFPNAKTYIRELASGPPVDRPIEIHISGPDVAKTFEIVDAVKAKLASMQGVIEIDDDWGQRAKKLKLEIDEAQALRASLSNSDIAVAVQTFVSGIESSTFRDDEDQIPIVLRSTASERRNLDLVRNLSVFSQSRSVPLGQVADADLVWEYPAIHRQDRARTVTAEASTTGGVTALTIFNNIRPWLEEQKKEWPFGYDWEFGGDIESSEEANAAIGGKLPIAGLAIVMLLVLQFNSLRKSSIVLSAIMLGLIGVVVGLVVMKSVFGFMALLGVVSLAGIVVNNAIVLLDRIQLEIDEGRTPAEAIMNAAQQRVRPILLTTATTVASLIPLYLSGGAMWEPLAVVIMFGLVLSTFMTLLVVPLLYALMYRVGPVKAG
ncbi:MAG: efflux RND transporter permease subunit [Myxococcota bacterium]